MSNVHSTEICATFCFFAAIIHTFAVKRLHSLSHRHRSNTFLYILFRLLGEIELVFGLWATIFLSFQLYFDGPNEVFHFLMTRDFSEAAFVFLIMAACATSPILYAARRLIEFIAYILPIHRNLAFYSACLTAGPLLGSIITEPAAITVTAFILLENFFSQPISQRLKYATLALLFVNISIGGTLTPYAAPPVLMVAKTWNWDLNFMWMNFGWKALMSVLASTSLILLINRKELLKLKIARDQTNVDNPIPIWIIAIHLFILIILVASPHHLALLAGVFFFLLGFASITREYQKKLKLRESILVALFLAGIIILGGPQKWWLEPLLAKLNTLLLYCGSTLLTAITDNAALTYLGSQIPNLSEESKYALVAGAVTGGGLTIIANAPNPAGYSILNPSFGEDGISPLLLFIHALLPTFISGIIFWFL